LLTAVSVTSMPDRHDLDDNLSLADVVDDSELAATGRVQRMERRSQLFADSVGVLGEWPVDEVETGNGHCVWQIV
jgi:hypothetical protein